MSESIGTAKAETMSDYTEYETKAHELEKTLEQLKSERNAIIESITGSDKSAWEKFNTGRKVTQQNNRFFVERTGAGGSEPIPLGAIMTDHEWDKRIHYMFPNSVSSEVRIQYVKEFFDTQIREQEFNYHIAKSLQADSFTSQYKKDDYIKMFKEINDKSREDKPGVKGERLTYTFMKSLSLELSAEFGLEIKIPKPETDLDGKADLIISRHLVKHKTGVINEVLDNEEEVHHTGIQLTVTSLEDLAKIAQQGKESGKANKYSQIEKALAKEKKKSEPDYEDLFLVSFGRRYVEDAIDQWTKAGRPSGGPSKFLTKESKQYLIENLLQKLYSKDEIDAVLRKANLT